MVVWEIFLRRVFDSLFCAKVYSDEAASKPKTMYFFFIFQSVAAAAATAFCAAAARGAFTIGMHIAAEFFNGLPPGLHRGIVYIGALVWPYRFATAKYCAAH